MRAPDSERQGLLDDAETGKAGRAGKALGRGASVAGEGGAGEAGGADGAGERTQTRALPARVLVAGLGSLSVVAIATALLLSGRGQQRLKPQVAEVVAVQSLSEQAPAGFDFGTALAIKWAAKPEDCIEVHMKHFSPLGQGLESMTCGTRSAQWLLPEGLQGQINWAGHPEYCLATDGNGELHLQKCADVSKANSEFKYEGGRFHMKARPEECMVVDSHTKDSHGRHKVVVNFCNGKGGDAIVAPAIEDFQFLIDWPTTTTVEPPSTKPQTTQAPTTVAPSHHVPSRIILRSTHGKYVAAEHSGAVYANRPWADDWEKFDVTELDDGSIALRTHHKTYVTVSALGTISALSSSIVADAHIHLERNSDGAVTLKSAHGKYIAAEPSGFMIASRTEDTDWEHFQIIDMGNTWPDHVAIKAVHGHYLRAYPHGALKADGAWPLDSWETFQVLHKGEGVLALRCDHGEYMKLSGECPHCMIHASSTPSTKEMFSVAHLPDGNFTMQTHDGKYLAAFPDGTVHVASKADHKTSFQVIFVY